MWYLNQSDPVYVERTKLDWTSVTSTPGEVEFVNVESPSVKQKQNNTTQTNKKQNKKTETKQKSPHP